MAKRIALFNHKGGVSKTTTTVDVSALADLAAMRLEPPGQLPLRQPFSLMDLADLFEQLHLRPFAIRPQPGP